MPTIRLFYFPSTAIFCELLATNFRQVAKINSKVDTSQVIGVEITFAQLLAWGLSFSDFRSVPSPFLASSAVRWLMAGFSHSLIRQPLTWHHVSGTALDIRDQSENQRRHCLWNLQSTGDLALPNAFNALIPCITHVVINIKGSKSSQT